MKSVNALRESIGALRENYQNNQSRLYSMFGSKTSRDQDITFLETLATKTKDNDGWHFKTSGEKTDHKWTGAEDTYLAKVLAGALVWVATEIKKTYDEGMFSKEPKSSMLYNLCNQALDGDGLESLKTSEQVELLKDLKNYLDTLVIGKTETTFHPAMTNEDLISDTLVTGKTETKFHPAMTNDDLISKVDAMIDYIQNREEVGSSLTV